MNYTDTAEDFTPKHDDAQKEGASKACQRLHESVLDGYYLGTAVTNSFPDGQGRTINSPAGLDGIYGSVDFTFKSKDGHTYMLDTQVLDLVAAGATGVPKLEAQVSKTLAPGHEFVPLGSTWFEEGKQGQSKAIEWSDPKLWRLSGELADFRDNKLNKDCLPQK